MASGLEGSGFGRILWLVKGLWVAGMAGTVNREEPEAPMRESKVYGLWSMFLGGLKI